MVTAGLLLQQVQITQAGFSSGPAAGSPVASPEGRDAKGQATLEGSFHMSTQHVHWCPSHLLGLEQHLLALEIRAPSARD